MPQCVWGHVGRQLPSLAIFFHIFEAGHDHSPSPRVAGNTKRRAREAIEHITGGVGQWANRRSSFCVAKRCRAAGADQVSFPVQCQDLAAAPASDGKEGARQPPPRAKWVQLWASPQGLAKHSVLDIVQPVVHACRPRSV